VHKIEVIVDLGLYSQTSIIKAAYRFTGDWFVQLIRAGDDKLTVSFTSKRPLDEPNLKNQFLNELLDQRLREQISAETQPVRNLIMAHALSKLGLGDHIHDGNSPTTDQR
jgi:His-Xaa-Ser system protein HxsD